MTRPMGHLFHAISKEKFLAKRFGSLTSVQLSL